ncbi:TonB-dependent receptor [uncultured Sphingomonas sp.]|uniref:TonB-dependent receptor domain-containing protein n=1 Tax=uncultured Sphingomonas sp. TaxID=158754 RepID=UPI0025D10C12|nr:TonB-dependent receptor [uncultured Sphingomonas sp.]
MIDVRHAWRLALLSCTALAPAIAHAQSTPTVGTPTAPTAGSTASPGASVQGSQDTQEQVEISAPGASADTDEIVVTGRNIPNPVRATPQVVSVLSSAEIARTGEGDIAGALTRVTGLSVVGNGFVYVRGLGDRYSSALLNGLPLPSPEPLKRVVPLDIFPTSVIASAVVQKSYSANYPGEFGGGVINLTTPSVPKESFFNIGVSGSWDTQTTDELGYTYHGSKLDYLGFDTGKRDVPDLLQGAIRSGNPVVAGSNFSAADVRGFAASLTNADTTVLQRNKHLPPNFAADLSAGKSVDLGAGQLGFVASASFSNGWRTRDTRQQTANDPELASLQRDFRTVITDNRAVTSGLLSVGYDANRNKVRLTGLYIRDTLKQGRLSAGYNASVADADPIANPDFLGTPPILQQNTYWFERQLIDLQAVGEFHMGDLALDLRGGYANSQRESPYERDFTYTYDRGTAKDYVNFLSRTGGQSASVAFNDLNENVWAGGVDLSYRVPGARDLRISGGYAYNKTDRTSSRYLFDYVSAGGALPIAVAQERPDYLVSDYNIYTYDIRLSDASGAQGTAAYAADLRVHAGYGQVDAELLQGLRVNLGVRYEDGRQSVLPAGTGFAPTLIKQDYWLPAATVTWNFAEDMQFRVAASKTIARPQFRELAFQVYQDPESDRQFTGNPFLTDSKLKNAEARYEYYYARDQRISVAGFFKRIDNPIEQVGFIVGGGGLRTGFANAPKADLYGAEAEVIHYLPLDTLDVDFLTSRRVLLSANYTYTHSKLKLGDQTVIGPDLSAVPANVLYREGAPLTGQSDHIVNLQLGLESTDHLSQQTVMLNYASKRVTNRGPIQGSSRQPDIFERPGVSLDFVAREGFTGIGKGLELKFEARNLLGRRYREYQSFDDTRVNINNYKLGRILSLGGTLKF